MVINPIVGVYIPIIRIPIRGGMTIPNIVTFDHGTYNWAGFHPLYTLAQVLWDWMLLEPRVIRFWSWTDDPACGRLHRGLALVTRIHVSFFLFFGWLEKKWWILCSSYIITTRCILRNSEHLLQEGANFPNRGRQGTSWQANNAFDLRYGFLLPA